MDFNSVNPNQIMQEVQNPIINSNSYRLVTGGNKLDELSFGQKVGMAFKRIGGFVAKLAGGICSLFPGWGKIASSALYGIGGLADRSYQNALAKRNNELALDEAAAQSNFAAVTPGFGMFGSPSSAGTMPPANSMEMQKLDTVLSREMAAKSQINIL